MNAWGIATGIVLLVTLAIIIWYDLRQSVKMAHPKDRAKAFWVTALFWILMLL